MSERVYGYRKIIDTAGKTKLISLPESFIKDYGLEGVERVKLVYDSEIDAVRFEVEE